MRRLQRGRRGPEAAPKARVTSLASPIDGHRRLVQTPKPILVAGRFRCVHPERILSRRGSGANPDSTCRVGGAIWTGNAVLSLATVTSFPHNDIIVATAVGPGDARRSVQVEVRPSSQRWTHLGDMVWTGKVALVLAETDQGSEILQIDPSEDGSLVPTATGISFPWLQRAALVWDGDRAFVLGGRICKRAQGADAAGRGFTDTVDAESTRVWSIDEALSSASDSRLQLPMGQTENILAFAPSPGSAVYCCSGRQMFMLDFNAGKGEVIHEGGPYISRGAGSVFMAGDHVYFLQARHYCGPIQVYRYDLAGNSWENLGRLRSEYGFELAVWDGNRPILAGVRHSYRNVEEFMLEQRRALDLPLDLEIEEVGSVQTTVQPTPAPRHVADDEQQVGSDDKVRELKSEDAATAGALGETTTMQPYLRVKCFDCVGSGRAACDPCRGTGGSKRGFGPTATCAACGGSGHAVRGACPTCGGAGEVLTRLRKVE